MDPLKRSVGAIAAGALLVAVMAAPAAAAPNTPPVIVSIEQATKARTSYFQLRARPGGITHAGRIVLRNPTRHRVQVAIDPLNAQTATTLGSAYDVRGIKPHDPATWLQLGTRRVVLPPRGMRRVDVAVQVPRGAGPGDHLSGVGIQALGQTDTQSPRSGVAVASVQRYAIGVNVRVPGPHHPGIVLESARAERQPSGLVFLVHALNAGTENLQEVTGHIEVTQGDRHVAAADVGPGTFVTGTAIDFPVPARAEQPRHYATYRVRGFMRFHGGIARIDTLVHFGQPQAAAQQRYGGPTATPRSKRLPVWPFAAAAAALLLAGIAWAVRRRRGRTARVLAGASSARPVGILVVDVPADQRRRAAKILRERAGRRDVVAKAGVGRVSSFILVSPAATGEDVAATARALPRAGIAATIASATSRRPLDVAAAIQKARAATMSVTPVAAP